MQLICNSYDGMGLWMLFICVMAFGAVFIFTWDDGDQGAFATCVCWICVAVIALAGLSELIFMLGCPLVFGGLTGRSFRGLFGLIPLSIGTDLLGVLLHRYSLDDSFDRPFFGIHLW